MLSSKNLTFKDKVANTGLFVLLCKARVMLFTQDYLQKPGTTFFQRQMTRPNTIILKDDILLGMVQSMIERYGNEFKEQEYRYFGDTKLYDNYKKTESSNKNELNVQPLMPKELLLTILTREKFFRNEMSQLIKKQDIKQILVLGSGLDSISIRKNHFTDSHEVRFFEVDRAENFNLKQDLFEQLKKTDERVSYLAQDYTNPHYLDELASLGFDFKTPSLVIWGGNSMYLEQEQFRSVLHNLHQRFNDTSLYVAFDYMHDSAVILEKAKVIDEEHQHTLLSQMINGMKSKLNIDFKGYKPQELPSIVEGLQFTLYKHTTAADHVKNELGIDNKPIYSEEVYSYAVIKNR